MKEKEVTYVKKIRALRAANPKLTEREACLLLGIKPEDLLKEQSDEIEMPEFFKDIFKWKK